MHFSKSVKIYNAKDAPHIWLNLFDNEASENYRYGHRSNAIRKMALKSNMKNIIM